MHEHDRLGTLCFVIEIMPSLQTLNIATHSVHGLDLSDIIAHVIAR